MSDKKKARQEAMGKDAIPPRTIPPIVGERFTILFRQLNDPCPPHFMGGLHWQVECWDSRHETSRPWGVAWVTNFQVADGAPCGPVLDYLFVCDDCRRRGVATAIVRACSQALGKDILLTEAISPEGEAFLDAIRPEEQS